MNGTDFVAAYAKATAYQWEQAAVRLAEQGGLVDWPWVTLDLSTPDGAHRAKVRVRSDYLAVGTPQDYVRLPLTPRTAQTICNMRGSMLPTPWLAYQAWKQAPVRLDPTPMAPNAGANLRQYEAHSRAIDAQLKALARAPEQLVRGHKKEVVVANIPSAGKVLIFAWYKAHNGPASNQLPDGMPLDVYDNGQPMLVNVNGVQILNPKRQPIQPLSNVHGDFYVDYSHGIAEIDGAAELDGTPIATCDLYQHPTLSALVNRDGPVRVPRYPADRSPAVHGPSPSLVSSLPGRTADDGLRWWLYLEQMRKAS
jgi:hypothetical protein